MKRLLLPPLLLVTGQVTAQAPDAVVLTPGYWQRTTKVNILSVDGKKVPQEQAAETTKSSTDCYFADDTKDIQGFFAGAAKDAGCDDLIAVVENGTIAVSGKCLFQGTSVQANGTGHFNSTNFQENLTVAATIRNYHVVAAGVITGKYLRPCSSAG